MTEIHAFDPDGTPSPGAQAALEEAVSGLASQEFVADTVAAIPEAGAATAGLMSAGDWATLSELPEQVSDALRRGRTAAVFTYGTTAGGVTYSHFRTLGGGPVPGMLTKRFATSDTQGEGAALAPVRETPSSIARRTGAAVVFNASGWKVSGNVGEMRGPQIFNGVVYHDFEDFDASPAGVDALGVRADGTIAAYSQRWGDTAASMVADGVVHSWSHGPVVVRGGARESLDDPRWAYFLTEKSARQIVGANALGELMVTTVRGNTAKDVGLNAAGAGDLAVSLGYEVAVLMDGGGSAQARVGSTPVTVSSDAAKERPVPDALCVDVDVIDRDADTGWLDATVLPGFAANQGNVPQFRKRGSRVEMRRGLNATGLTASGSFAVASLPAEFAPAESKYLPVGTNSAAAQGQAVVSTTGGITLRTSPTMGTYYMLDPLWWTVD